MPKSSRYAERPAYFKALTVEFRRAFRLKVLARYGGRCQCPGCEVKTPEFLQFDHIRGGGKEDRARFKSRYQFYRHIYENYDPKKYQLLCSNCNLSRGKDSFCPLENKPHGITRKRRKTC